MYRNPVTNAYAASSNAMPTADGKKGGMVNIAERISGRMNAIGVANSQPQMSAHKKYRYEHWKKHIAYLRNLSGQEWKHKPYGKEHGGEGEALEIVLHLRLLWIVYCHSYCNIISADVQACRSYWLMLSLTMAITSSRLRIL